jgi:hypothetical protein
VSARCWFGIHDWRRRERMRRILPPGNPLSFEYREEFEQCRRCDKTRDGWVFNPKLDDPPPEPAPWGDEP